MVADGSFENVEDLKYFRATPTDKNSISEKIKSRLSSGNSFNHSV
jgi:hypothetical protein